MNKWSKIRLGELATVQTGPFGSQLHKEDYVLDGTPIITVEHLGKRKISYKNLPLVSDDDKQRLNKYILQTGDIVFSRVGSVDRCSLVCESENGWLFSGRCLRVRIKNDIINSEYLYNYLCLEDVKEYIRNIAVGATMPSLNTKILSDISIVIPPRPIQKVIADTLSSLDEKIEINDQINKNLEKMAQVLYRSWFVNFEPFQDDQFVDSELGKIPKGWRAGKIEDLGNVVGGSTPSKAHEEYYTTNGIAWITPKDLSVNKGKFFSKGTVDITELGLKNSSAKIMPKGTVLFSSRAPIGYITIAKNDITTNQGFKSIIPKENIGTEYVYGFLKGNLDVIVSRASGSTFKEVSGSVMKKIPALIPSDEVLSKFNAVCHSYFDQQELLEAQNRVLIKMRDTLLPKLMSGEIPVPVEEVIKYALHRTKL